MQLYALYLMVMFYMFRASLAHHQEFKETVFAARCLFNYSWFCLLFVTWCICAGFCGSWNGVRSHTIPGPTKPCTDTSTSRDKQKTESRI